MEWSNFLNVSPEYDIHQLNFELYKELNYYFETNATIRHCYNILYRFSLHDIEIKNASPIFKNYIQEYIIPFLKDSLRMRLILGWCPVYNKKIKPVGSKKQITIPAIAPLEYMTVELHIHRKKFKYQLKFFDELRQKELKHIYPLFITDIRKLGNGNVINSLLYSLLGDLRIHEEIKKYAIQAEYTRSKPSIYLRETKGMRGDTTGHMQPTMTGQSSVMTTNGPPNARVQTRNVNFTFDATTAQNAGGRRPMSQAETMEQASKDMMSNLRFHANQMQQNSNNRNMNYYKVGLNGEPQFLNNLFLCPPGMELASNPQMAETRIDPVSWGRDLSSKIYVHFSIPEPVFGFIGAQTNNDTRGSTTRGNKVRKDINIMDLNNFDATIKLYNEFFSQDMVIIYNAIFEKIIDKKHVKFLPPELYGTYLEQMKLDMIYGENRHDPVDKNESSSSSSSSSSSDGKKKPNKKDDGDKPKKSEPKKDEDKPKKKDDDKPKKTEPKKDEDKPKKSEQKKDDKKDDDKSKKSIKDQPKEKNDDSDSDSDDEKSKKKKKRKLDENEKKQTKKSKK